MKGRISFLLVALCLTLNQTVPAQSAETRPRRVEPSSSQAPTVSTPSTLASSVRPEERAAQSEQAPLLEAMVPRAGLLVYLEIRSSGLARLAQSPDAIAAVSKIFVPDSKASSAGELTGFVMKNIGVLSNARLAVAGYGAKGMAAIIEVANPADTERLKADLSRLSGFSQTSNTAVAARGRVVIAGVRSVVESFIESDAALTLDEDREYLKARAHFVGDPFFVYLDIGSMPIPLPAAPKNGESDAYMAGVLAGLSQMPYAIVIGGSMQSEDTTLRALLISSKKQSGGLLSSIFSAVREGQPTAASFAAPDTDLFLNVMVDWDTLYGGLHSLFDLFAGAIASGDEDQSAARLHPGFSGADLLAGLDVALGFSIRYDLLPTLGNEFALSISGDSFAKPPVARAASTRKPSPLPKMVFMVAVRNPVKFEEYLKKLLSGPKKTPLNLAQMPYRGAMIKHQKSFAYTIANGFFIAGPTVGDVRRSLDARASGVSLASNADFRSAVGPARPSMLQVYISSKMSGSFGDSVLAKGDVKQAMKDFRAPLGLVMTANPDGTMMQIRMPSKMALAALASMTTSDSSAPGINYSSGGVSSSGGRRRSPTLTTEDLRYRRP